MRNNNLLKVFSGQQNKRYKLKGKAETPFTFEGENLFSAGNKRLTFKPVLSDIAKSIWIRIWYINGNSYYNSPYYQVQIGKSYMSMLGGTENKMFLCTKTGYYNVQYGYDSIGDATGNTNPVYLEEGKTYYAKFTYDITSDNKVNFSNIIISEKDIPYVPYIKPLVVSDTILPLSLHSNNGDRDFVSMLIKGYTEKSGESILSANTPLKFTGENLLNADKFTSSEVVKVRCTVSLSEDKTITMTAIERDSYIGEVIYQGGDWRYGYGNKIPVKPNTTYFFWVSNPNDFNTNIVTEFNSSNKSLGFRIINNTTFTTKSETSYITVRIGKANSVSGEVVSTKVMLVEKNTAPTTFEPYKETLYNPTEGFSLNGFNNIYDTFNTINGELTKRFGVVDLGTMNWKYNASVGHLRFAATITGIKYISDYILMNGLCSHYDIANYLDVYNNVKKGICLSYWNGTYYLSVYDNVFTDETTFKQAMSGVYLVYELATPQTYQKKPKTLPQWVKHCFDNNGRELDMTLTPITLAEPVADTYQNANGKITRKTNKVELSIQNSVAQEYTGYSYLLKFTQPLAKPNTPILCDLENTNIVQDSNYLIVEYHNPSFTTQEQYYNYFLYEKHELIYERATYDTETIRSVMINRQYTKCTDKNGVEVEMEKA